MQSIPSLLCGYRFMRFTKSSNIMTIGATREQNGKRRWAFEIVDYRLATRNFAVCKFKKFTRSRIDPLLFASRKSEISFLRRLRIMSEGSSRSKNFISFYIRGCKDDEAISDAHLVVYIFRSVHGRYTVCIITKSTF